MPTARESILKKQKLELPYKTSFQLNQFFFGSTIDFELYSK